MNNPARSYEVDHETCCPKLLETPRLVLHVPGASSGQRGVDAAEACFKSVDVDAAEARNALIKIEDADIGVPDVHFGAREFHMASLARSAMRGHRSMLRRPGGAALLAGVPRA